MATCYQRASVVAACHAADQFGFLTLGVVML